MITRPGAAAAATFGTSEAKPIEPIVEKKPDKVTIRTAAVSMVIPHAVWNGRLQHPDPVLRQFGGPYGMAFYRLMLQQDLSLSADCSQWEDRINAIDRVIKPGDPESDLSEQMAKDCRSVFRRLQNVNIINLWMLRCRWYGVTAIGKAGWKKDPGTGLYAPFDLYNIDPWRWKFGPNFEPYLLTQRNPWQGEPIPARSVHFSRWGSLFTAYGESDLRDVYLSCWYRQTVVELLLQSIEVLGRPIPWIEVGDSLQGAEFDDFETGIAKQYKFYVITRTPNARTSTTFPNLTAIANGGVGRSEIEFLRYHDGLIQRKILGSQQTQDKTGGSRALEESRIGIANDKTPPGSQLVDHSWTDGYLEDISLANWATQPRELWPVMDSDAGDIGKERLTGPQIVATATVANQLRLKQVTSKWAIETLVMAGFDRPKAAEMVASMLDPKAGLSKESDIAPRAMPQPHESDASPDDAHLAIPMENGEVLRFGMGAHIPTRRGVVPATELVSGDELVTVKQRKELLEMSEMAAMADTLAASMKG